ncbi:MAG: S1 RNA-binding domain-containing protein, partial [Finegoldia magna]|uniref:S1 RNA-binding domain-containing protein n=1 Tax=Finegoldia magna TaxID=1260 RepID=UPI002915309D
IENYKNKEVIVVAGGTGLSPVRGIVEYFSKNSNDCTSMTLITGFKSPEDVLKVGDEIETLVLKANREKNRISLGLKQLQQKPFDAFVENNHEGDVIEGEVVNLVDFGAFVKLAEGIEGLVHVSEISNEHVDKPSDELNIGDTVKVKILEINPEKKRIALSMKALLPKPEKPERKPRPKKVKPKKVETKPESSEETLINSDLGALLDLKLKEIEEDN